MPPAAAIAIACLPPYIPSSTASAASMVVTRSSSGNNYKMMKNITRWRCKARASSTSDITDFDLYDLMGIDSSSDHSEIRRAYRTLQKRCHPDIAGPAGHDMAIILNEAYALLSDPNQRLAYDKEHSKIAELRGYSGKPIYSAWFGSSNEERAVFVDEVKCVGCLKCALCAEKTFAIESVYGRARVVGQWADPEHKIQEAIQACPVDCISVVERSNLAALEFLMSKQPRGNVRVGMGNAGIRVSNIFVEVKKFQTRFQDAKEKAAAHSSNETDLQREARVSAIQAIRSISNWLYWKTPFANAGETSPSSTSKSSLQNVKLIAAPKESSTEESEPNIGKIRDAAAARKQPKRNSNCGTSALNSHPDEDDYWTPLSNALPAAASTSQSNSNVSRSSKPNSPAAGIGGKRSWQDGDNISGSKRNPIKWVLPMGPALVAALLIAKLQGDEAAVVDGSTSLGGGGLKEHIYGSVALDIVNSSWLQIVLVGITWYIIGMIIVGLADALQSRKS